MQNGMENSKITYKILTECPEDYKLNEIIRLYQHIFNDADRDFFIGRFNNSYKCIITVLAYSKTTLVGFKIGYPKDENVFYSWIGGVHKEYRKLGIAQKLLNLQEDEVKKKGFKIIQTKSMNRFKPMMLLNLKNGFDIIRVYTNTKLQTKIVFEKALRSKDKS